jgi:hypothetical protein
MSEDNFQLRRSARQRGATNQVITPTYLARSHSRRNANSTASPRKQFAAGAGKKNYETKPILFRRTRLPRAMNKEQ